MFMGFLFVLKFVFILELLADIDVEEGMLLPFDVLSFDDFVETGVSLLSRLTQTFILNFGLDVERGFLVFL